MSSSDVKYLFEEIVNKKRNHTCITILQKVAVYDGYGYIVGREADFMRAEKKKKRTGRFRRQKNESAQKLFASRAVERSSR